MAFESGPTVVRETRPGLGYRPELDGVRAVAIICVLSFHAFFVGVPPRFAGILGVDVFFVLSGYLITTLLLDEDVTTATIHLGRFYARRALRLLPALALMLVVAWLVVLAVGQMPGMDDFGIAVASVVAYVGNWRVRTLGVLSHAWSLAIEEQFYLLWPPILVFCLRRGVRRRSLAVAMVVLAAGLAVASAAVGQQPPKDVPYVVDVFVETYTRAMGILLGCAIALVPHMWRWARSTFVGLGAIAIATLTIAVESAKTTYHYRFGIAAFNVAVTIALAHVVHSPRGPIGRALSIPPLVAIGRVSYGVYLYHVPIFWWIGQERFVDLGYPSLALALAIVAVVSAVSYVLVERPALRLKERFRPGPRTDRLAPVGPF